MKARGRPRLEADEATVNVHFRLTTKQYDASQKRADQARLSLPAWLRQVVVKAMTDPRKP